MAAYILASFLYFSIYSLTNINVAMMCAAARILFEKKGMSSSRVFNFYFISHLLLSLYLNLTTITPYSDQYKFMRIVQYILLIKIIYIGLVIEPSYTAMENQMLEDCIHLIPAAANGWQRHPN